MKRITGIFLILLFCISFSIRFYKLPDNLFFGFEQGRDAFVIRDIYLLKNFTLVGPKTDIGGIFHGPWYYYLMTIPYGLSAGNPLAASLFLVLISSTVPIVIYFLYKDIFNSEKLGLLAGIISVFSFELIIYARWLSNVTLAVLFVALAYYTLWKYLKIKKNRYFILFVIFASFASQFEIILVIEFIFAFILLLLLRLIHINRQTIFWGILVLVFIFSPLIWFDLRHQHLILNSIFSYGMSFTSDSENFNLINTFDLFQSKLLTMINRTLINHKEIIILAFSLISILYGLLSYISQINLSFKRMISDNYQKQEPAIEFLFLTVWSFMSISIFLIGSGLEQAFVGSGLGWIGLFLISLRSLWQQRRTQFLVVILFLIVISGWIRGLFYLNYNKESFFVTIQDDLNLSDQRKILNFIHEDSKETSYRLTAFTIPYLHPEGWEYLHKYYYPNDKQEGAKLVYIVIERHVDPVWEEKWINDLGNSRLITEKYFGKLRLQKRTLEN